MTFFNKVLEAFSGNHDPAGPDHYRAYAIGDIHGRIDLLQALLAKVEADIASRPRENLILFLWDLSTGGRTQPRLSSYAYLLSGERPPSSSLQHGSELAYWPAKKCGLWPTGGNSRRRCRELWPDPAPWQQGEASRQGNKAAILIPTVSSRARRPSLRGLSVSRGIRPGWARRAVATDPGGQGPFPHDPRTTFVSSTSPISSKWRKSIVLTRHGCFRTGSRPRSRLRK